MYYRTILQTIWASQIVFTKIRSQVTALPGASTWLPLDFWHIEHQDNVELREGLPIVGSRLNLQGPRDLGVLPWYFLM
jgi:hypothetical protein